MVSHATFNSSIGFQSAAQCQYACIITYLLSFTFTYLLISVLASETVKQTKIIVLSDNREKFSVTFLKFIIKYYIFILYLSQTLRNTV